MAGGHHNTNTHTVNNVVNEDIHNVHNNEKNIDNYMYEHNIVTDMQYGDRALGGMVHVNDDVNAGESYYRLQNLGFLGDLSTGLGGISQVGGQVVGIADQVAPGKTGKAQQYLGIAGQIGGLAGQFGG